MSASDGEMGAALRADFQLAMIAAREMVERRQLPAALMRVGSNAAPIALSDWWDEGLVSVDQLREVLLGVWCRVEWPQRHLSQERWCAFFAEAGFLTDRRGTERPTRSSVLYRGATTDARRRMAWTINAVVAEQFAERSKKLGFPAIVWQADVSPNAVLAIVHARNEGEIVVDPALLGEIRPHA